jgi:hypothetical protein
MLLAIDIRERIDSVTSATTLIDGAKAVRAHFAVDGAVPVIDAPAHRTIDDEDKSVRLMIWLTNT